MKKIVSLLLSLIIALFVICSTIVSAYAATSVNDSYYLLKNFLIKRNQTTNGGIYYIDYTDKFGDYDYLLSLCYDPDDGDLYCSGIQKNTENIGGMFLYLAPNTSKGYELRYILTDVYYSSTSIGKTTVYPETYVDSQTLYFSITNSDGYGPSNSTFQKLMNVSFSAYLPKWNDMLYSILGITMGNFGFTSMYTPLDASYNNINIAPTLNVESISIKTLPKKLNYYVGENLDTSGMVVSALYSDGTSKDITNGFVVSGYDSLREGTQIVTVEYEKQQTFYTIAVNSKDVSGNTATLGFWDRIVEFFRNIFRNIALLFGIVM